jgi:hypothetical protein
MPPLYYTIIPTFDIEEAQIDKVWPKSQAILLMAEHKSDGIVHLGVQHRKEKGNESRHCQPKRPANARSPESGSLGMRRSQ